MQWQKPRDKLKVTCYDISNYADKISRKERDDILNESNYTCRFCGGKYYKYMMCTYLSDAKCNDVCCRMCFLVSHLNSGFGFREFVIYKSNMTQLEIIRKTAEFIINNGVIPIPNQIDSNVKSVIISTLEFISIINNSDSYPPELLNYKLFFTSFLDINFLTSNYGNNISMFVNDYSSELSKELSIEQSCEKSIPTKNELALFNKFFK